MKIAIVIASNITVIVIWGIPHVAIIGRKLTNNNILHCNVFDPNPV